MNDGGAHLPPDQPAEDPDSTRLQEDVARLLTTIKSGSKADARNSMLHLITHYRDIPAVTEWILKDIESDPIIQKDGSQELTHSSRWNDLGLSYLYRGNRSSALEIFLHLSRREVNSPATFNNLGCALVSINQIDQARFWFLKAYNEDMKRAGPTTASRLPAYKNLDLLNKRGIMAIDVVRKEADQEPPSPTPQVGQPAPSPTPQALLGLSRPEIRRSIITHFLLGGVLAGFILTLLSSPAQYLYVTYQIPEWVSLLAIGASGTIVVIVLLFFIYQHARES